jgi:hypothetical protein
VCRHSQFGLAHDTQTLGAIIGLNTDAIGGLGILYSKRSLKLDLPDMRESELLKRIFPLISRLPILKQLRTKVPSTNYHTARIISES